MKTKVYLVLFILSALCMSADSDAVIPWLIWEACWVPICIFCGIKLLEIANKTENE